MPVPTAYLTSTKNTAAIFDALRKAGVPGKFTYEFLKQLGYGSSGDRPFIAVLKSLKFLDDSNAPTERYRRYKDPSQSKVVLAEALREAYADVFAVDQAANTLSVDKVEGLFSRLSDKGDAVIKKMSLTFRSLSGLADFSVQVVDMEDKEEDEKPLDRSPWSTRHTDPRYSSATTCTSTSPQAPTSPSTT